jgi:hypothetical protein
VRSQRSTAACQPNLYSQSKETASSIIPAFLSGYLALPGCTFGLPHTNREAGAEASFVSTVSAMDTYKLFHFHFAGDEML